MQARRLRFKLFLAKGAFAENYKPADALKYLPRYGGPLDLPGPNKISVVDVTVMSVGPQGPTLTYAGPAERTLS